MDSVFADAIPRPPKNGYRKRRRHVEKPPVEHMQIFSGLETPLKRPVEITERDLVRGKKIVAYENLSKIDKGSLFLAGIYSILSNSQDFPTHYRTYCRMIDKGLDTPESILARQKDLWNVIRITRFPNKKKKFMNSLADSWLDSSIPEEILDDVNNGRKKGMHLRNLLADNVNGLGLKCASFVIQKAHYIEPVMIDIWVERYLESLGYAIEVADYRMNSGLKDDEYLHYEKIMTGFAESHGVTPVDFQAAVWSKLSRNSGMYVQVKIDYV